MSSWKLPKSLKQLKETHLGTSSSDKSRSASTSTITQGSLDKSASSSSLVDGTATSSNPGDVSPSSSVKPGLLIVTLHEAKDLTLPSGQRPPSSGGVGGGASRPGTSSATHGHSRQLSKIFRTYCVLEFDKTQVVVNANSGVPDAPVFAGNTTQFKFDVSREAELSVGIYMRNPGPRGAGDEDVFLGSCRILPSFEEPVQGAKKQQPAKGFSGTEWIPFSNSTGSVKIGVEYRRNQDITLKMSDFELMTVVGKGSFGKVMQVKKRDTQRIYALKTIRKQHIISRSEVNHTLAERTVLAQINNPFIVPLKFSFQSPEKLYLVLAFVNGGELFHHLQREGKFDINRARFYTAELLCALECLHGFNVIYRDLKPENILLDYTGHIALCDFGLCKLNMKEDDRTNTFCGTPEYLAPELLLGQGYTKSVDWWTLGVLLYEMLTGLPPFYDENTNEMYKKILQDPLQFPPDMDPHAKSLLIRLLDRDPAKRLGANGAAEIKSHRFFETIDWRRLLQKKIQPTFRPNVLDAMDTKNFDPEFTQEMPADSVVDGEFLSQSVQQQFTGWSYNRPGQLSSEAPGSIRDPGHL
ncbi:kinase-like domain-containing protein [Sphaerosporella brunnea]|uniref:non-specific serine/threonine protein kinase n=1 Tax=Sphaerosporella brunnea TaxID=1250544 RepID=A0A5J5EGV7_9PEZI|nr:kinase-like domain-containing protein [Sphaerosporella brunnea]